MAMRQLKRKNAGAALLPGDSSDVDQEMSASPERTPLRVPRMPNLADQSDAADQPQSIATPARPCKARRSPRGQPQNRTLVERVSWTLVTSQELRQVPNSPRTPAFRMRPTSPPSRSEWRRSPEEEPDMNEGRLRREFSEIQLIGKGQFSTVYKAQNRVDRCFYAVKKTIQVTRGLRESQLKEALALASVSMEAAACPYIVRYYSSWVEDSRLHIQTELCRCSLRDKLLEHQQDSDPRFQEGELIEVLQHVASGLKKLHGLSIVHLDIKPDNILLSRGEPGYFKIADLGLAAAAIGARCDDITEGDCRYLAKEVLQGDFADLPKADVFSLGLVLYELGTNPNGLPSNGPEWHSLRRSLEVARLPELSPKLLQLMQDLVQPRKELRPTCEAVLQKLQEDADFSHPDPVQVQALQDEARRCREEAMRNRQRADEYWQEILCLKKQELMCGKTGAALGDGARVQLRRSKTSC
mmetsp:Transcript_74732/g.178326  ORF Transcript_74732/g.178326 Transcript_74732/m.178326 type:complete len:469 (+) Transcript_74732:27-1433(+)